MRIPGFGKGLWSKKGSVRAAGIGAWADETEETVTSLFVLPNVFSRVLLECDAAPSPGNSSALKHPCSHLGCASSLCVHKSSLSESSPGRTCSGGAFLDQHRAKSCLSVYFFQLTIVQNNYLAQII